MVKKNTVEVVIAESWRASSFSNIAYRNLIPFKMFLTSANPALFFLMEFSNYDLFVPFALLQVVDPLLTCSIDSPMLFIQ